MMHQKKIFLSGKMKGETLFTTAQEHRDGTTLIYQLNLRMKAIYQYNEAGVLLRYINYSHQVEKFGELQSVSPDGFNYIFYSHTDTNVINIMMLT